jgi:serine protease AprX
MQTFGFDSFRKRAFSPFFAIALIAIVLLPPHGTQASAAAKIDPVLQEVLARATGTQPVQAVVTFSSRPSLLDVTALSATGVRVMTFSALPMVAVQGTAAQVAAVAALALPRMVSVYYNRPLQYFLDESVELIGATTVWSDLGFTGQGVTVAVLDSGIDGTHPDLTFGSKVVQNVKLVPDPFAVTGPVALENLATTDSSSGHGTHCASTIAGSGEASTAGYRGVAPGARLVGLGAGELIVVLSALEGFDWILQNRTRYNIRVVSNSWGTSGAFDPADPINVASKLAHDAGITVVFAAGNAGPENDTLNPYAVAPWVIGVAAGNKDGATLADFSSRGIPGDPVYQPTITAPGVDIVAARALTGLITPLGAPSDVSLGADAVRYTTMSGTSMATPHVAGVVALMLEANPSLTPGGIRDALRATATPMDAAPHEAGAGYVDALAAVTRVQGTP